MLRQKLQQSRDSKNYQQQTGLNHEGNGTTAVLESGEGCDCLKDIIKKIKGKINIVSIEYLKNRAYSETGDPKKLEFTNKLVGMTKWFDGTVLDLIWNVKE